MVDVARGAAIGARASGRRPPAFRSWSTTGVRATTVTTVTSPVPAGVRAGDVLLAVAVVANTLDTFGAQTGWTSRIGPIDTTGTGTNQRAYLFTRIADGTEGSTFSWTKTGTGSNGSWRVTVTAWSSTAGIDVSASNLSTTAGDLAPVLPSVTPTLDNGTVVGLIACRGSVTVFTPAGHYVEMAADTASGGPVVEASRRNPVTAAATGTATAATNVTTKWATFSVALKPA